MSHRRAPSPATGALLRVLGGHLADCRRGTPSRRSDPALRPHGRARAERSRRAAASALRPPTASPMRPSANAAICAHVGVRVGQRAGEGRHAVRRPDPAERERRPAPDARVFVVDRDTREIGRRVGGSGGTSDRRAAVVRARDWRGGGARAVRGAGCADPPAGGSRPSSASNGSDRPGGRRRRRHARGGEQEPERGHHGSTETTNQRPARHGVPHQMRVARFSPA